MSDQREPEDVEERDLRRLELGMAEAERLITNPPSDPMELSRRRYNLGEYWAERMRERYQ